MSRNEIPWYPAVDAEKCSGCRSCYDFCSHATYIWDEDAQRPVVKNPFNCVVGCSTCAAQCPSQAIAFPPLSILKQYREPK
ncbi:MAG: 4Fe-4S dicluster domain-containing protein [Clostridia bacterium]|nr:4Fe-4S dicluster domain-containing protein [Clostridia bacterium]